LIEGIAGVSYSEQLCCKSIHTNDKLKILNDDMSGSLLDALVSLYASLGSNPG